MNSGNKRDPLRLISRVQRQALVTDPNFAVKNSQKLSMTRVSEALSASFSEEALFLIQHDPDPRFICHHLATPNRRHEMPLLPLQT
mmetsp:Transcript_557/g.1746  ORF Transcript_557/g.1746 Transcript_557/m.1746 type:complete len:86 (+) Transcript_557:2192-2449(+)